MGKRERGERPKHTVAEVIQKFEMAYLLKYRYTYAQKCVVNKMLKCRTEKMGGHIRACQKCGKVEIAYNSCKDRQCPTCGAYDKAQWLEKQKVWVLPIDYFHIIFTIDHVFNPLVWENQKAIYNLIMRASAAVMKEFGKKYLGGEMGFTMSLHTWGQKMQRHLHTHTMATGGALVEKDGEYHWKTAKKTYLFPAEEFSAAFRAVFCEGIRKLHKKGKLRLGRDKELDVEQMLKSGENQNWEVYIQTPQGKPGDLLDYLGRYVYKTAMSNHRILAVGKKTVRFEYYDNQDDGTLKELEIDGVEFIRRFLDHVLPRRFQRVRHYGLHHSSKRKQLSMVRRLLGLEAGIPKIDKLKLKEWLKEILGEEEPFRCPYCGQGEMEIVREFSPIEAWRLKFAPVLGWMHKLGWAT
jgi:rubrerythrin